MASFITLLQARAQLWQYASKVSYAARTADDELAVTSVINLTGERLLTAINFRGSFSTARLRVFDEQVTCPNPIDGIRSIRIVNDDGSLGQQFDVLSRQANYAIGSCYAGFYNDYANGFGLGLPTGLGPNIGVRDLGNSFATFRDGSGTYYIRCKSTLNESAGTILLRGLDDVGAQVYTAQEGVSLAIPTVAGASTTTTQKFTELSSWVRSGVSNGVLKLYAVDTTTGDETLLVNITPNKLTSGYRRYSAKGFTFGQTVEALCNIAFVPAVADNDPVLPAHLGALKLGMMALQYEDKNDMTRADDYMQRAVQLLDADRDRFDGDEVSNVVFAGFGQWPARSFG